MPKTSTTKPAAVREIDDRGTLFIHASLEGDDELRESLDPVRDAVGRGMKRVREVIERDK